MPLYHVVHPYSRAGAEGLTLRPGWPVYFTPEQAAALNTDSPGVLRQFTDAEIDKVNLVLKDAHKQLGYALRVDWGPLPPKRSWGTGGGEAMSVANSGMHRG